MSHGYASNKPKGQNEDHEQDDDDATTVIGSSDHQQVPEQVNYNPRAGAFDGSTLIDGETSIVTEGTTSSLQRQHRRVHSSDLAQTHLSQIQYNENRVSLDRSINTATAILQDLRSENSERPVYFPTNIQDESIDSKLISKSSRLALLRQNTITSAKRLLKQPVEEESSVDNKDIEEESYKFELLKIDLKISPTSGNMTSSLDKTAMSQLLNEKFSHITRHLRSLKERIDDTSSKVLVTGDLNSGKSAFCNALLRKRVLPEDQQPCTNVFCEIIDARDNNHGIEEVHAVPIGATYEKSDERTYKIFQLKDLEELVYLSELYSLLIVYVTDNRPRSHSLLKNGVIDIKLIDAPGLNLDSYQTTQVFSRQEEIDLVVFVVNAENHFTLSGREFISSSTSDRNLMFIVVNKFDNIKNKDKCKQKIMDQVQILSPETHKDSNEFVHFVSSREVLDKLPGGGDGDGDGGDEGPDDDDESEFGTPDFDHLEASLRSFVLGKRSISKLLPAKNYLLKLYNDLLELSKANEHMYLKNRDDMKNELNELTPKYEETMKNSVKLNEQVMKILENTSSKVYDFARDQINITIDSVGELPLGVPFEGYSTINIFARRVQERIIDRILESVDIAEDVARDETGSAIEAIKQLGIDTLGEGVLPSSRFLPEKMYSKRKDNLQRHIQNEVSITDFIDPDFESFCKMCGVNFLPSSQHANLLVALTSNQMWKTGITSLAVLYGPQLLSWTTGLASCYNYVPGIVSKKIFPAVLVGAAIGLPTYYLYQDAPHAYQRNIVKKIKRKIDREDYQNLNCLRISKEVRKVLSYPSKDISNCVAGLLDTQSSRRSKVIKDMKGSEVSLMFYKKLTLQVMSQKKLVESFDLESAYMVD